MSAFLVYIYVNGETVPTRCFNYPTHVEMMETLTRCLGPLAFYLDRTRHAGRYYFGPVSGSSIDVMREFLCGRLPAAWSGYFDEVNMN